MEKKMKKKIKHRTVERQKYKTMNVLWIFQSSNISTIHDEDMFFS